MAAAAKLPGGALLGFYQTLATSGSVPYIIASSPIDPLNEVLFNGQSLSTGTIDSGTWSSNGATVAVISAAPAEGAGNYIVSPYAPNFGDAALTTIVKAPATTATTTSTIEHHHDDADGDLYGPGAAAGREQRLRNAARHRSPRPRPASTTPARCWSVPTARWSARPRWRRDSARVRSVAVSGLPAQQSSAAFYVTVRAWNSGDPTEVTRQWSDQLVDMRAATSGSISINLD